ncbi:MAG TPA: DUF455 family protein [Kofleriaceae bacterium]|nr:DUF455 family protein [Kofleriaceae bacterium]
MATGSTEAPAPVELTGLALAILAAETLDGKLAAIPPGARDHRREPARRIEAPARPPELRVVAARAVRVPPVTGMADPSQRARILHALANHELQAVELFAWALVAFPDAPPRFRRGLAAILNEEQSHMRLYMGRLEALGRRMGDFPVTGHFWNHLGQMSTPLQFACVMGLTFENANLDFAQDYAEAARAIGDVDTAAVLDRVHREEIRHVRFAWRWIERWRGDRGSTWQIYQDSVAPPLGPGRARGRRLCVTSRRAAGLDDEFIAGLESSVSIRPSGAPR